MSNTKNSNWINAIRAYSIVAVFFVHSQLYCGRVIDGLNRFVYPCYVNALFFVSGYLLFWKQLSAPRIDEDRKYYVLTGGCWCSIYCIDYDTVCHIWCHRVRSELTH